MDLSDAYANAAYIPGGEGYPARWAAAAAAFRARAKARLDLPYGPHPRQRFDLFLPEDAPRGLVVFFHGGYWMAFDRSDWSHLAAGPLARGWAVAMPSYRLAPEVRLTQIARDAHDAVEAAGREVSGPVRLAGHSAGGQLAARMACVDAGLSAPVVERLDRIVAISALSDLRPLLQTDLNDTLCLDPQEAAAESPALCPPRRPVSVTAWVGGDERPAFLDQSRWLAEAWPGTGVQIEAGRHHFNVIDGLEDPDSPLTGALAG